VIKLVLLFVTTGAALMVAVALIVGIAWIAVAIPVVIVSTTGYGLVALNRRWRPKSLIGERRSLE
jgi:F0F1-type ATP synthase membrane subunit c/vacuolar-type H+-ATPase subunit K